MLPLNASPRLGKHITRNLNYILWWVTINKYITRNLNYIQDYHPPCFYFQAIYIIHQNAYLTFINCSKTKRTKAIAYSKQKQNQNQKKKQKSEIEPEAEAEIEPVIGGGGELWWWAAVVACRSRLPEMRGKGFGFQI